MGKPTDASYQLEGDSNGAPEATDAEVHDDEVEEKEVEESRKLRESVVAAIFDQSEKEDYEEGLTGEKRTGCSDGGDSSALEAMGRKLDESYQDAGKNRRELVVSEGRGYIARNNESEGGAPTDNVNAMLAAAEADLLQLSSEKGIVQQSLLPGCPGVTTMGIGANNMQKEASPKKAYLPYLEHGNNHQEESSEHHQHQENGSRATEEALSQPGLVRREGCHRATVSTPGAFPYGGSPEDLDDSASIVSEEVPIVLDSIDHHDGLVEAQPVQGDDDDNNADRTEAQPVVSNDSKHDPPRPRQPTQETTDKIHQRIACVCFVISCIVVTVSLVLGLNTDQSESNTSSVGHGGGNNETSKMAATDAPSESPTPSPTRPLPPMEDLELLYEALPENSRESLYNSESPQYLAWEWLLLHPNIAQLAEWKKKQVFAMATFYFSFEGPHWREQLQTTWMNASLDECSWVINDQEVAYWAHQTFAVIGPGSYQFQDFHPCNSQGELQTLIVHSLSIPANLNPSIPPQIGLLRSLKILGMAYNDAVGAELATDMLTPEVIHLPNLEAINFQASTYGGSIPTEVGLMTSLRHLVLGGNDEMTGTIPTEMAMAPLEHVFLTQMDLRGSLPSELGLMTKLTGFEVLKTACAGPIPSELALLTQMRILYLPQNHFTGTIPSELGLLTDISSFSLETNYLTGSIPTQLGLMSSINYRFWLQNNLLGGLVPSQLGLMTNVRDFNLGNNLELNLGRSNDFTGSLPREVWELSQLETLHLPNLPNLSGKIPEQIFMPNLTAFNILGSPHLFGTIPDQICSIEDAKLEFECNHLLCGCNCTCAGSDNATKPNA